MIRNPFWRPLLAAGLLCAAAIPSAWAEAPRVVATISPVHALTAGVMAGVGEPHLLVPAGQSPHTYALRPSDARALQQADIVFHIGEQLETFLQQPLRTLAGSAQLVTLMAQPGLLLLPARRGGTWEAHTHDHDHAHDAVHGDAQAHGHDHDHDHDHEHAAEHGHAHGHHDEHEHGHEHEHGYGDSARAEPDGHGAPLDPHIWLHPANARVLVEAIAAALSVHDPAHAATYQANAEALAQRLAALEQELDEMLAPVRDRPFLVFHDGYQYFERAFGLRAAGSITVGPEQQPGAQRLRAIRDKIVALGAVCVFREPQFPPSLVETVVDGTDARIGELDPLGGASGTGAEPYFTLLRTLAGNLRACLAAA